MNCGQASRTRSCSKTPRSQAPGPSSAGRSPQEIRVNDLLEGPTSRKREDRRRFSTAGIIRLADVSDRAGRGSGPSPGPGSTGRAPQETRGKPDASSRHSNTSPPGASCILARNRDRLESPLRASFRARPAGTRSAVFRVAERATLGRVAGHFLIRAHVVRGSCGGGAPALSPAKSAQGDPPTKGEPRPNPKTASFATVGLAIGSVKQPARTPPMNPTVPILDTAKAPGAFVRYLLLTGRQVGRNAQAPPEATT